VGAPGTLRGPQSVISDTAVVTITVKPTAIEIQSFNATGLPGGILLNWETVVEFNTDGFHIWRSTRSDFQTAVRVTTDLVDSRGGYGASYGYLDTTAEPGFVYYYWLEEVELDGTTSLLGPVMSLFGELKSFYLPLVEGAQ
jgi:hypothetical protein